MQSFCCWKGTRKCERRAEICVAGEGRVGGREIGNLLSHHDWSHDDRWAKATIACLYLSSTFAHVHTRAHTHTHKCPRHESKASAPYKACHWELVEMLFCGAVCSRGWSHLLHFHACSLLTSDSQHVIHPFFFICFQLWLKCTCIISFRLTQLF